MELYRYLISAGAFFSLLVLETLFPLFRNQDSRWRHIGRNFGIVVIDNLIFFILLSFATGYIWGVIEQKQIGIFNFASLPFLVRIGLMVIVFDLWMYLWHRLVHTSAFFWRFHRMHHSDPAMDASTALRFHPGEILFSTLLRWGVFLILGMTAKDLLIYEMIMMPVIFFHHSNYFLPAKIDKILRPIIVTPWMHWVHHSHIFEETNSNYGTIFSWWDRLFASFRLRNDPQKIHYGLDEIQAPHWQTIWGMLKTPFVNKF